jgi:hypothetical protein
MRTSGDIIAHGDELTNIGELEDRSLIEQGISAEPIKEETWLDEGEQDSTIKLVLSS